jgi:hypothetical protein
VCGSGPASRSRLLSCFERWGSYHGKGTVGWRRSFSKGRGCFSFVTPVGSSTHPFDRLHRRPLSTHTLFIIHSKDRVLLIHFPPSYPIPPQPVPFNRRTSACRADTPSLVDRHPTTNAPLSSHPFKPPRDWTLARVKGSISAFSSYKATKSRLSFTLNNISRFRQPK